MAQLSPPPAARPASLLHATAAVATAALALVVADVFVRLVPFRWIAGRIQKPLRRTSSDTTEIRRIQWAIAAAHRRLPWTVKCLATAIAANRLLARQGTGSELWLGGRGEGDRSIGVHAWLLVGDVVVTGAAEKRKFQPLHAPVTTGTNR